MIRVKIESEGAINFLTKIDSQLEDSIEKIIEDTIEEVESIAQNVVSEEYTFKMPLWPLYYHGQKEINGTEGSVTIPHDFVPINAFYYVNEGEGGDSHTLSGDRVVYKIHQGFERVFKSNYFLNNRNAHYRTTNKSKPFYSYFLPDIPQMLWEEKKPLMEQIEEAFQRNIDEALGDLF